MLRVSFPSVNIISLPENRGFAGGYNDGLPQIITDYYLIVNSDIEVTPGFIEPLIELLENNDGIGICQPKLRPWKTGKCSNMQERPEGGSTGSDSHLPEAECSRLLRKTRANMIKRKKYSGRPELVCALARYFSAKYRAFMTIIICTRRISIYAGGSEIWV